MNVLAEAMGYIDDDFISEALKTKFPDKALKPKNTAANFAKKGRAVTRGDERGKAVSMSVCAVALAIIIGVFGGYFIWAIQGANGKDPNNNSDTSGGAKSFKSFDEIYEYYPDRNIAEGLNNLEFEYLQIALSYHGDDWTDSDEWCDVIINGYCNYDEVDRIAVYCRFAESLDYWKKDAAGLKHDGEYSASVGGVEVQIAYWNNFSRNYSIFEINGIVYVLYMDLKTSTFAHMQEITEDMLKFIIANKEL